MPQFLIDLRDFELLQLAVLTGVLASIACGIVGSYVVVRRMSYVAGAIAHCTLGGMGLARYLQKVHGLSYCTPIVGALAAAMIAALIIGWVTFGERERQDTVLSAIWSIGMALGVIFISLTPGYSEDLMSYLFGNILMVSRGDVLLLLGLDLVVVGISLLCFNRLLAICFDEEHAWLQGVNVRLYYLLLLCLISLTVVLLTQVVGLVMVIALLSLPAAAAGWVARRLWQMMALAIVFCIGCTMLGLGLSYGPNLPAGATIIVVAGLWYVLLAALRRPLRRWLHRGELA